MRSQRASPQVDSTTEEIEKIWIHVQFLGPHENFAFRHREKTRDPPRIQAAASEFLRIARPLVHALPQKFEHSSFRQEPGVARVIDSPSSAVPDQPFFEWVAEAEIVAMQGYQPARVSVVVM